jgi:hypothetical protein
MGLELVEMVMRLEEEFEITIPNEAAEKMTTPRKVINYLMNRPEVSEKWSHDYVHLSVWMIIEDELCVKREKFTDDSRFVQDMGAG